MELNKKVGEEYLRKCLKAFGVFINVKNIYGVVLGKKEFVIGNYPRSEMS